MTDKRLVTEFENAVMRETVARVHNTSPSGEMEKLFDATEKARRKLLARMVRPN